MGHEIDEHAESRIDAARAEIEKRFPWVGPLVLDITGVLAYETAMLFARFMEEKADADPPSVKELVNEWTIMLIRMGEISDGCIPFPRVGVDNLGEWGP